MGVRLRICSSVIIATACCAACSAPAESTTLLSSAAEPSETLCPTGPSQPADTAANSDGVLWLRSYDATEISSVASDGRGSSLLARAGRETLKLDAAGLPLWSKPFGSVVVTDRDDNVFIAGTFELALDLGTTALSSTVGRDVYVVKLDSEGKVVYAVALGADGSSLSLAVAAGGNAVISGSGLGTVMLDESGRVAWARPYFGRVAVDALGSTLLTGGLRDTQDFGGGALSSHGGEDVFVVKLGPHGEHLFSKSFGDVGEVQRGESVAIDPQGNVVIAGVFDGSIDFGSGTLTLRSGTCAGDAWCKTFGFAAKLDGRGETQWSASLGPMRSVQGASADAQGSWMLSGALPGGVTPFRSAWLAALAANGAELWHRAEWPETGIGAGHGVAVGPCNDVIWAVSARPSTQEEERSYVAKLSL